jgi:hypothetical protein
MEAPVLISKEEISTLIFLKDEVLYTKAEILKKKKDLEKAMIFGNGYKGKIKIIFQCSEGCRMVETTVWATTEDSVVLKGGVCIPIVSIKEVIY